MRGKESSVNKLLLVLGLILLRDAPALAQKLDVKVIDRQDHTTDYSYVVPGYSSSTSTSSTNCTGDANTYGSNTNINVNCGGTTTTNGYNMPALAGRFSVRGSTLSLLLPDGRIAVVNCDIKFAEHFAGAAGNHRNCRIPLVDHFQADFNKDKAKLMWPVSLDGKKIESETYKILALLDKKEEATKQ
jgi:hypothetical protein